MAGQPMGHAYCPMPTGDAYCSMPPAALIPSSTAAAHITEHRPSSAGIGNLDMTGIIIIAAFTAYAVRHQLRRRWARQAVA